MREGGKILRATLDTLADAARAGMKTKEFDRIARERLARWGAQASFLDYNGFPAAVCVSINEEIVHGLPSERELKPGDVLKLDLGVFYKGFHTDSARTIVVGMGSDFKKQKLLDVTRNALELGIEVAKVGNTVGDIGHAIQEHVESENYHVVRDLVGHGIGRDVHEEPEVLNYGKPGQGPKLVEGMVIAIEPMVVEGDRNIIERSGGVYATKDGKLAAHFEHTVAVTKAGPLILTN